MSLSIHAFLFLQVTNFRIMLLTSSRDRFDIALSFRYITSLASISQGKSLQNRLPNKNTSQSLLLTLFEHQVMFVTGMFVDPGHGLYENPQYYKLIEALSQAIFLYKSFFLFLFWNKGLLPHLPRRHLFHSFACKRKQDFLFK